MIKVCNSAPKGMRPLIAIIGKMNVGKSSLLNALTEQSVSITDEQKGTTTDTVIKNYELLPFGPVVFYDTAGFDDKGTQLSSKRVKTTIDVLEKADLILLVTNNVLPDSEEQNIKNKISQLEIPLIVVSNNRQGGNRSEWADISVSATSGFNIDKLKQLIVSRIPNSFIKELNLLDSLVKAGDKVGLITPLDEAAPKGRLILPQAEVLREILDKKAIPILSQTVTPEFLECAPKLVIVDSSVISKEYAKIPCNTLVTTFSLLFANNKGNLREMIDGAKQILFLKDNDKILVVEACSHRVTCSDIGRTKIPKILEKITKKVLNFEFATGNDFPDNLSNYSLVVHCGACMLSRRQMLNRIKKCNIQKIPVTNYGLVFALSSGLLDETTKILLENK